MCGRDLEQLVEDLAARLRRPGRGRVRGLLRAAAQHSTPTGRFWIIPALIVREVHVGDSYDNPLA
jgi:hypothetical protein